MTDLVHRLKISLEPILDLPDPRERVSAYHDIPYALFRYEPRTNLSYASKLPCLKSGLPKRESASNAYHWPSA
jgi:hypothetical protein